MRGWADGGAGDAGRGQPVTSRSGAEMLRLVGRLIRGSRVAGRPPWGLVVLGLAMGLLSVPASAAEAVEGHGGPDSGRYWASGNLFGWVTDGSDDPAAGARVEVFTADSGAPITSAPAPALTTITDSGGGWQVRVESPPAPGRSIAPGRYLVRAVLGERSRWYANATDRVGAEPVEAVLGENVSLEGIELPPTAAPTSPSGVIAGRVRGNGEYLSGIPVTAVPMANRTDEPASGAADGRSWPGGWREEPAPLQSLTGPDGRFTISGVPVGSYAVRADGNSIGLLSQWYLGADRQQDARAVRVVQGAAANGVDFDISYQISFPNRPKGRLRLPRAPVPLRGVAVDPLEGYQGQKACRAKPRSGTIAVRDLIFATYGSAEGAGLNRACGSDTSEHYDGRAIDWMVDSGIPDQARKGDSFTWWLTKFRGSEAGANARRLGVMYVIWRGKVWAQYRAAQGWQTYSTCDKPKYAKPKFDSYCHRNHVHVSLTMRGAGQRTSWWTGRPAG